ncbi:unnamed protein product [Angiostrongylus costaricensis]|uniref:Zf-CHCC domain-containing protein n=1 Tax=Angiostrongylus costaricensis TaxID=334426 RepID=A0A158PIF7_ANGCS|nr:unnamed protein product [Angiostrongylus costaricensis]
MDSFGVMRGKVLPLIILDLVKDSRVLGQYWLWRISGPRDGFSMEMEARDRATLLRRTISNRSFSSLPISYTSSSSVLKSETITSPYPLKGRDVVLDLESRRQYEELRRDIRKLGGRIVDTVDENKLPKREGQLLSPEDSDPHSSPGREKSVKSGKSVKHYESKEHSMTATRPGVYDEVDMYIGAVVDYVICPAAPLSIRLPDITPKEEPIFRNDGIQDFEYSLRTDKCSLRFCRTAKNL